MVKVGRLLFALFFFGVFLGGGFQGCGKKGDPRPPGVPPPASISDLRVKNVDSGIVLTWSIPDTKGDIQKFKIQRSEMEAEMSCPDCPNEYSTIADIASNDPSLSKAGSNVVSYLDSRVKAGFIYTYRIIICDIMANCSEPSHSAVVKINSDFHQRKGTEIKNKEKN